MSEVDFQFTETLRSLGAREFQVVALSADPARALAAIAVARDKGVEHLIGYALSLFDNPEWTPKAERKRHATNLSASISECDVCGGDRFVGVSTRKPQQSSWMKEHDITPSSTQVIEEMGPCPKCGPTL